MAEKINPLKTYRIALKDREYHKVLAHWFYIEDGHLFFKATKEDRPNGDTVASFNSSEWIAVVEDGYRNG